MIGNKLKQHFAIRRSSRAIARLYSGNLSERDTARLKNWPEDTPEYRQRFIHTMQLLADIEPLADDPDLLKAIRKPAANKDKSFTWQRPYWPKYAVAVLFLLALTIGFEIFFQPSMTEDRTILRYVTRVGERKLVELDDGSSVHLNTGTELLVDLTNSKRRVILERGEAYFAVVKDSQRPFSVELGERSITVLGTEFTILKSPEKFTLAVIEGVVSLHRLEENASSTAPSLHVEQGKIVHQASAEQRRIHAGTVVEFDVERRDLAAYQDPNISRLYNWRTGVIHFEAEPLYKVILEMNRYSGKKILIKDPSIMEMEVYAAIKLDRLDVALTVLERALPIKVIQHFDRIEIERSCKPQEASCN